MPEFKEFTYKIKTNLKDRVGAVSAITDNIGDMADDLVRGFREMKPVQGVLRSTKKVANGTLDFLIRQCEITRRWG